MSERRQLEEKFIETYLTEIFLGSTGETRSRLFSLGNGYFARVHARPQGWMPWSTEASFATEAQEGRPRLFFLNTLVKDRRGELVASPEDAQREGLVRGQPSNLYFGELCRALMNRLTRPFHPMACAPVRGEADCREDPLPFLPEIVAEGADLKLSLG